MKQWLSLFLIILFSFQALPVRELGKLLKKSATEQVQDDNDPSGDLSKKDAEKEMDKFFLKEPAFFTSTHYSEERVKVALHNLPLFKNHFHPEITTPPPNTALS